MMNDLTWKKYPAAALATDATLHAAWDHLNSAGLDLPFMCSEAVSAAVDVFGDASTHLLVGSQGGAICAMFVVVPDGRLRFRTFQPSQLPLGAWVSAKGMDPVELSRSLMRGPLGLCLVLSITQIDPLQAPAQADAPDTRHSPYIDTAWVDIQGTFEDYWAARGKNLRQNMRKQRNKLLAEGTATQMRVWLDAADMAPALQRYGLLETAGWKASQGTAIGANNEQGRFYTKLFEQAAVRGEAFVTEYLFGEQTVAMNLGLLRNGILVVLKTAYDETVPKALSPASLLREEELQSFFSDDRFHRIEYYGKVMEWHTKLTEQSRQLYHLTTYRWPVLKRLAERRARQPEQLAQTTESAPGQAA